MTEHQRQQALARQIAQVHAPVLKKYHARLLCKSLVQMLKAGK